MIWLAVIDANEKLCLSRDWSPRPQNTLKAQRVSTGVGEGLLLFIYLFIFYREHHRASANEGLSLQEFLLPYKIMKQRKCKTGWVVFLSSCVSDTHTHTHGGITWYDIRERAIVPVIQPESSLQFKPKAVIRNLIVCDRLKLHMELCAGFCRLASPRRTTDGWNEKSGADKSQWYGSPGSQALCSVFCFYPQLVKW